MTAQATSPDPAIGWVRATLGLALLAVLARGDQHGYALAQRITEFGLGPVRGGALYPVLGRLESEGAVVSLWRAGEGGPGRKVYSMTGTGRSRLAAERSRWHEFSAAMERLLGGPNPSDSTDS
jgi:PadR family transcriptional regulator, regulatory protein PadR